MKFQKLGRTELDVSKICLGTMTWGKQNTQEEGHDQLDFAFEQGVNFIDTAEMYPVPPDADTYTATEDIIGQWLAKTGRRKDVVLATKIAGPGPRWIREGKNRIDPANLKLALEGSLKRLRTDYIDLYQLHWPNRNSYHFQRHWNYQVQGATQEVKDNLKAVLETLDDFVKAGKIRYVGLSNETAWGISKYLELSERHGLPRMVSVQNEYSLLCRLAEPDLHEIAVREDCGLLAWSPLSRGILSGKYLGGVRPAGTRLAIDPRPDTRSTPRCEEAVGSYVALAKEHCLDPCQMALAFVNTRPFVTSTIIGATNLQQLRSNIESINVELSKDVLSEIDRIRRHNPMPY